MQTDDEQKHLSRNRTRPAENGYPRQRGRYVFFCVMGLIAIFVIWPGYTLFSSATPFIFGFPLSFAWIVFCTMVEFIALIGLYFTDISNEGGR